MPDTTIVLLAKFISGTEKPTSFRLSGSAPVNDLVPERVFVLAFQEIGSLEVVKTPDELTLTCHPWTGVQATVFLDDRLAQAYERGTAHVSNLDQTHKIALGLNVVSSAVLGHPHATTTEFFTTAGQSMLPSLSESILINTDCPDLPIAHPE